MKNYLFVFLAFIFSDCSSNKQSETEYSFEQILEEMFESNDCGCHLSEQEMIYKLPIVAIRDSIKICKIGTVNIGAGPITWLEYLQLIDSDGLEGQIYNCNINEDFEQKFLSRNLLYKDKSLFIYYRLPMDVYFLEYNRWFTLDVETYSQKIYAENDSIFYSEINLDFTPPFQSQQAIDSTLKYCNLESSNVNRVELKKTVDRLFISAINGSENARKKFFSIPDKLKSYFNDNPESLDYYNKYLKLLNQYENYIEKGGEVNYSSPSDYVFPRE
ncbi:MAG: hypothetical protein AB8B72_06865 [Crocinitomicaceae bacterium]